MPNKYTFNEKNKFSKIGVDIVSKYLETIKETISVINVENDPKHQRIDVDLIWKCKVNEKENTIFIEVKADKYTTGNFWLETKSNESAGTLGCFVKTESDFVFYYFTKWDRLYILPTEKSKKWFKDNIERFEESKVHTIDNNTHQYRHTTVGRKVPIKIILDEVKGIKVIKNLKERVNNS